METKPRAFVIMPFQHEFDAIYTMFIKETLVEAGFEVFRADDIRSQNSIIGDIVSSILTSDLVVADLSEANPNVFYELGLAHAFRKPVILLTQDVEDVPFDLRSYRLIRYSTHFADFAATKETLLEYGNKFKSGDIVFGSPVTDFQHQSSSHRADSFYGQGSKVEQQTADDRGWLDHAQDLYDGYERLAQIIAPVLQKLDGITNVVTEMPASLSTAMAKPAPQGLRETQRILRGFAVRLDEFTALVESANSEYATIAKETDNSLEILFGLSSPKTSKEKDNLTNQLNSFVETREALKAGKDGFLQLANSMDQVPPIDRILTKSVRKASGEIKRMADNLEKTISSISRAIESGRKMLDDPELGHEEIPE